jgi:hypothetical protein
MSADVTQQECQRHAERRHRGRILAKRASTRAGSDGDGGLTDRQTDMPTCIQAYRQTETEAHRHTDGRTGRQTATRARLLPASKRTSCRDNGAPVVTRCSFQRLCKCLCRGCHGCAAAASAAAATAAAAATTNTTTTTIFSTRSPRRRTSSRRRRRSRRTSSRRSSSRRPVEASHCEHHQAAATEASQGERIVETWRLQWTVGFFHACIHSFRSFVRPFMHSCFHLFFAFHVGM